MRVAIADYGLGNILSVISAVSNLGFDTVLDGDGTAFGDADVILVPGVAAFGAGMDRLQRSGQAERLLERHAAGQGIVGLCLGAQLFLNGSSEAPGTPGLGIANGEVVPLDLTNCRIPNQGWMEVKSVGPERLFATDGYYYFSHSYRFDPGSRLERRANAWSGDESFLAVYSQENVIGVQFHPEKSGGTGLIFLSDILNQSSRG